MKLFLIPHIWSHLVKRRSREPRTQFWIGTKENWNMEPLFYDLEATAGAPKVLFCHNHSHNHNHNHNECTKSTCYGSNMWRRTAHSWATGPWGESPFSCFVRNILFRLVCYKRLALLYKLDTLQLFALLHDHMSEKRSNCANLDQAKADDSIFVFALAFFGIANMSC